MAGTTTSPGTDDFTYNKTIIIDFERPNYVNAFVMRLPKG